MEKAVPNFVIEYTQNKHSRAVIKNGVIIIRLAKKLTELQKKEHVQILLKKMDSRMKRNIQTKIINPFSVFTGPTHIIHIPISSTIAISIQVIQGTRSTLKNIDEYTWEYSYNAANDKKKSEKKFWDACIKILTPFAATEVHSINNETLQVHVSHTLLKFATSLWGSCSQSGKITLNPALYFIPIELRRYVIIHELAHRKQANHSPKFWHEVAAHMPNYKQLRKELRMYSLRK